MDIPDTLRFTGKDKSITGSQRARMLAAINARLRYQADRNQQSKTEYQGKVPNLFVGTYGYPNIQAGFLSSENYNSNDDPLLWSKEGSQKFGLFDIVRLRSELINSRFSIDVHSVNQLSDNVKEVSMAEKPVDADIMLAKRPFFSFSISRDTLPHGPAVPLKKLDVLQNPKIPVLVQKAESDSDLKAAEAIGSLHGHGFDEHFLTRVFSAGNLGVKGERKMVPTKWSITAVDDIIGKDLSSELQDYREHDYAAFFGGYLGNNYLALVFPGPWSYELFETYVGNGLLNPKAYESASDHEDVFGRKTYASNTVGGYYAARLAALEYFRKVKRSGRLLLLRFITSEYSVPLGVWVVREATRKAFESNPLDFGSKELMLKYAKALIQKRYNLDLDVIYGRSWLLKEMSTQRTLTGF